MTSDEIVDTFYAAYNGHEAAAAAALYRKEGWHEEVNAGRRREGRRAIAGGLATLFDMMPAVAWREMQRIKAGNSIVVTYAMEGRFEGRAGPLQGRGQTVSLPGLHVFEISGDAIAGTRDYWDMAELRRQIA